MNDIPSIRAFRIKKVFDSGKIGLHESTFEVPKGTLVAILGPSGCGKSTLLKALIGDAPATTGTVWLNGLPLNEDNIDYIKTHIGYVPQDDIVHNELTVEGSLKYAAHLRLTEHSLKYRREKVEEVLKTLNIEKIRKERVAKISGGQRKRLAIAIEILTDPSILFLDEPTSPLDPQTIKDFLETLSRLTRKGTTVMMVTHKPEDLNYMDKAIFMAVGGHITYFGDAKGYSDYFKLKNVIEIYSLLDSKEVDFWVHKYKMENPDLMFPETSSPNKHSKKPNFVAQYFWLSSRYFNIKVNDFANFMIMIGQAPVIALLICFIFDSISQVVPFFLSVSAIWFGANNAAREIVSEQKIYKRERMFNLGIFSYIFSKMTVLGVVAIIQSILFTLIISYRYSESYPSYNGPVLNNPWMVVCWMSFLTMVSTLMGLLISSMVNTSEKVMSIIPIVLIPQIMLAGIIVKIKFVFVELLSYLTLSRWGTTGFAKIQEKIAIPKPIIKEGTGKCLPDGNFIPPIPEISQTEDSTSSAIKEISKNFLNSANEYFVPYDHSMYLEIFAITALSLVFFIALYFSMQSKDSISIRN